MRLIGLPYVGYGKVVNAKSWIAAVYVVLSRLVSSGTCYSQQCSHAQDSDTCYLYFMELIPQFVKSVYLPPHLPYSIGRSVGSIRGTAASTSNGCGFVHIWQDFGMEEIVPGFRSASLSTYEVPQPVVRGQITWRLS